jgi:hypothetical protein
MSRALRALRPLRDLPPVVETLRALVKGRWIESRIYHDHAARVTLARAAQRIGGVEPVRPWTPPRGMTTALVVPCPAPLDKGAATL